MYSKCREFQQYLRPGIGKTISCPGCGAGIIMGLILRAIDGLKLNFNDMLFVSGIGCAARIINPYFNADVLHTLHGRAIAFATGAKMFNPNLITMIISGDGDLADIGGNHLIHAARRNIDLTVVLVNNMIYGTTGGQSSSSTPMGAFTQTAPAGNAYRPFDLCNLVKAAGAIYVARYSITQPLLLIESIQKALQTKGFCFVEAISSCPTQFGRRNKFETPPEMLEALFKKCITIENAKEFAPEELKDKIVTGEFSDEGD